MLGQITDKSDVYSFGVILWELASRIQFLGEVKTKEQLIDLINKSQTPNVPVDCPGPYGELVMRCLHRDPRKRPTFTEVLADLNNMQSIISDWTMQQFRGQALMATPPVYWGNELISLDPQMNVAYKLSIGSIAQEDSLESVVSDVRGIAYQSLRDHMRREFNDEILQFYERVRFICGFNELMLITINRWDSSSS